MRTITKKELIYRAAEKTGVAKADARNLLQFFLTTIVEELGRGNRLEFREFGVFEIRKRRPRQAQNPRTLEKVQVPERRVVKFKEGRLMRERLDKPERPELRPVPPRTS